MSADPTEQDSSGGEELRERYLPISRKELRRRREQELIAQREAQEEAELTADELDVSDDLDAAPAEPVSAESAIEGAATPVVPVVPADLTETDDSTTVLPAVPEDMSEEEGNAWLESQTGNEPRTEADIGTDSTWEAQGDVGVDSTWEAQGDVGVDSTWEAQGDVGVDSTWEAQGEVDIDSTWEAESSGLGDEEAPIPASRRARRLLRETDSLPTLNPELIEELENVTGEIAKADDPDNVDPELLKKQQALAAKAMQANQERMRRAQEEAEREAQLRRQQRPESEILTERMVRDSVGEENGDLSTGPIEPVHAQGAHGLELKKMVEVSARQADRQNAMVYLVVILAIALLIAVGVVIYFLVT